MFLIIKIYRQCFLETNKRHSAAILVLYLLKTICRAGIFREAIALNVLNKCICYTVGSPAAAAVDPKDEDYEARVQVTLRQVNLLNIFGTFFLLPLLHKIFFIKKNIEIILYCSR